MLNQQRHFRANFLTYGPPRVVRLYNGTHLTAKEINQILETLGVQKKKGRNWV